jgi:hypothetical protein
VASTRFNSSECFMFSHSHAFCNVHWSWVAPPLPSSASAWSTLIRRGQQQYLYLHRSTTNEISNWRLLSLHTSSALCWPSSLVHPSLPHAPTPDCDFLEQISSSCCTVAAAGCTQQSSKLSCLLDAAKFKSGETPISHIQAILTQQWGA